ncbi:DNA repair protein RecN [Porticoccaceae bacterium]|nr:DNA repair protein RecN [Porticoccaceae bacterium]MDA7589154.1 DNA repair protein RecN [Porticoccaceae bacterium]MDC0370369.1 DNA repair protein RecN [Porticoccaceae bacterium]MDC3199102.1 DNA repair protein RecN [Porticoccaceae bacterium]
MLLSINISNYTLVESLEIEFAQGTTAITGETGAGKSLVLDALGMALGDRADTDTIRHGKERAEITATFDINTIEAAKTWLDANDFNSDENCILRRIYTREGRSRGYINGQPSTMSQLQELGDMLTDIHSQHEHQSLLRKETHRRLLDEYANAEDLATKVASDYSAWHKVHIDLTNLLQRSDELDDRKDLLNFQVNELQQIDLTAKHLEQLELEQKTLANAEQIVQDSHNLLAICGQAEGFNLRDSLNKALSILANIEYKPEALKITEELLQGGLIQIEEAINEISHHIDRFEADPQRLQIVEEQLSAIFQLSRKHRVNPDQLETTLQTLEAELKNLIGGSENINALEEKLADLASSYEKSAKQLSSKRKAASKAMSKDINRQLQKLSMEGAELLVQLSPVNNCEYRSRGLEEIEFLLATNPGQPHKMLAKIASGGELSRVSLAIQVVAASHSTMPTLVFDEVDVGIGGSTADIVGQLMKQLGERGQVISVTHQPQVAAHAHHHYRASKVIEDNSAESLMAPLNQQQRVEELARMLGGAKVTKQTLSHASELLSLASA